MPPPTLWMSSHDREGISGCNEGTAMLAQTLCIFIYFFRNAYLS